MRKHRAVIGLLARSSLHWVLALCALLVLAEGGLFWWAMERNFRRGQFGLAAIWDSSGAVWVFMAVLFVAGVVQCLIGCTRGNRPGYTLRRLSVSRVSLFFLQMGYSLFCYLLLWAVQVALAVGLSWLCMDRAGAAAVGWHGLFGAFGQSDFLGYLLPWSGGAGWFLNPLLVGVFDLCLVPAIMILMVRGYTLWGILLNYGLLAVFLVSAWILDRAASAWTLLVVLLCWCIPEWGCEFNDDPKEDCAAGAAGEPGQ